MAYSGFLPLAVIMLQVVYGSYVNQMIFPDVSTIYSGPNLDYSRFPLTVYDRDLVTFRLRACGEGRVLVHATRHERPRDSHVTATEIHIGSPSSEMITVKEPDDGKELFNTTTDSPILDCGELRQFWISWRNSTLKMGRGPIFQQQTLVDMKERLGNFEGVDALFFATSGGQTGVWQFDDNSGVSTTLRTSSSDGFTDYWKSVENHASGFVFSVKAGHDAKIALAAVSGHPDYTVILGADNNARCELLKGTETVDTYDEVDTVNDMQLRPFWITWQGGLVEVGVGRQPGILPIMDYKDDYFSNVGHVGLATDKGSSADWLIKQDTENEIQVSTPIKSVGEEFDFFITSPRQRTIRFFVSGCSDAVIIFTSNIGLIDDDTIYVTLGADNNTKTTIHTGYSPGPDYKGKGLLKCGSPLPFWASWRMGQLRVGSGFLLDADIILSYIDPTISKIMMVAFANKFQGISVDFTVADNSGDQLAFLAPPGLGYGRIWISTRQEYFRVFSVMHCGGSKLLLTETMNTGSIIQYQLLFSADGKSVTLKRDKQENIAQLKRALQCNEKRTFWLSWHGNTIEAGEGHRYGEYLLVKLNSGNPYSVNALTMANDGDAAAEWEMEMAQDNILSMHMTPLQPGVDSQPRWYRLYENVQWLYVRLACQSSARLLLSKNYRDIAGVTHEITFYDNDQDKKVVVRKEGKVLVEGDLTIPRDGVNFRDYWLSWDDGFLKIGESRLKGHAICAQVAFNNDDGPTAALGFYPETNGFVEWELHNSFGPEATVITEPHIVGTIWLKIRHDLNSFMFTVDVCDEFQVTLTDRLYGSQLDSYVINVGNDGSTYIAKSGRQQVSSDTKNLLACGKDRYFWLTWSGGTVRLGQGDKLGEGGLLTWHDALPQPINAISLATMNSRGTWRFGHFGALSPGPKPDPDPATSGLGGGAIAGIVIGCLLLVVIIMFIAYVMVRGLPRALQRNTTTNHSTSTFNNPIASEQPSY